MNNKNWTLREIEDIKPLIIHLRSIIPKAEFGVSVVVTKNRKIRSAKQRKYYMGVIVAIIADNSGYSKHERWQVHEILKQKFCPEKETKLGMIRSTKLLNTHEEEIYHEDIRKWADEYFEITIPLPNETDEWEYEI